MAELTFPPQNPVWPPAHHQATGAAPYTVARVGPMGESFLDICNRFSIKFDDLILFNFGLKRTEPRFFEKINWYLKNKLGCTRTTRDGNLILNGGETIYIPPRGYSFADAEVGVPKPSGDATIIEGNATFIPVVDFRTKIQKCLDLLQTKAPQYFTWFKKYNLRIRAADASGANFQDGSAIDIAKNTFDSDEIWLASVIIHESIHFWQLRDGHYSTDQTVNEMEANRYQLGVLQLLGAPQSMIDHMMRQDGGHADLNGDGVYDWKDYELRKNQQGGGY